SQEAEQQRPQRRRRGRNRLVLVEHEPGAVAHMLGELQVNERVVGDVAAQAEEECGEQEQGEPERGERARRRGRALAHRAISSSRRASCSAIRSRRCSEAIIWRAEDSPARRSPARSLWSTASAPRASSGGTTPPPAPGTRSAPAPGGSQG